MIEVWIGAAFLFFLGYAGAWIVHAGDPKYVALLEAENAELAARNAELQTELIEAASLHGHRDAKSRFVK